MGEKKVEETAPAYDLALGQNELGTIEISIVLPRGVLSALRTEPADFVHEMRLAAAVKWYEMRLVSQAKAAEIAGVSRTEFLASLARFEVSPFQYDADEIAQEVGDA